MYTCARTLTLFFMVWKSPIHVSRREPEMKITIESRIFRQFLFVIALALTVATISQRGYAQQHKAINLSPARGLPFNDVIVAGNTLDVAGQEGTDDSGKLASGGIGPETTAALENIQKVIKAAGFELKD